jgi:hypothetical protein
MLEGHMLSLRNLWFGKEFKIQGHIETDMNDTFAFSESD